MKSFESRAWLLEGSIKSMPGILHWDGSQLRFVACGPGKFTATEIRALADAWGCPETSTEDIVSEKATVLITAQSNEISGYKMPWYYFKSGLQIHLRNRSYKFSLVRPQNTVEPSYYLEDQYRWVAGAGQEDVDVLGGKAAANTWKQILDAVLS